VASFKLITSSHIGLANIPTTNVDLALHDEEFSMMPFGIPGKILLTRGHTRGSVSALLETGDALCR
jgi:glyoxylase-like metal-dependent hydrolase (beta-lactamase superfamily II)